MTRFKHGQDVVVMFSPTKQGRNDYVWGLVFVGMLLMSVYIVWVLALYVMRRRGVEKHGWLSGAPFTVKVASIELERKLGIRRMSENQAIAKAGPAYARLKAEENKTRTKAARIRWVFFSCGVVYLVASILCVTHGVTNLQSAINVLHGSAHDINRLTTEAVNNLHFGLRSLDNTAVRIKNMLDIKLVGVALCPSDPSMQSSPTARTVKQQIDATKPLLEENVFIYPPPLLDGAQAYIQSARKGAAIVENQTANVRFTDWRTMLLMVFYICTPAYVITVCIFLHMRADFTVYGCVVACVFFPVMFLLTFAAWVLASMVIVALAVGGDFCYPNGPGSKPDDTVYAIAKAWGYNETDYQYQILQYYVSQCTAVADPLTALRGYQSGLVR
jgi:hypothetical protein